MKNIFKKKWKILLGVAILVSWLVLIYHPALKLNFSLIDDGQIVQKTRDIVQNITKGQEISGLIFEPEEGRVRPAYWLTQAVITTIALADPTLMHAARLLILVVICFYINKILANLKVENLWRFLAILLFASNFQNFENFYRLGPTEVFLGLYFLILFDQIFFKARGKINYSIVILVTLLGSFTKESFFIVALPILGASLLIRQEKLKELKKNMLFYSLILIASGVLVFLIKKSYGDATGYATNYDFTLFNLISRFKQYLLQINDTQFPLTLIAASHLVYKIYKNSKSYLNLKRIEDVIYLVLWGEVFLQLLSLIPWIFVLGRYLIIVNLSIALIVCISLKEYWMVLERPIFKHLTKNISNIKILLFLTLLILFIFRNIVQIANYQTWQKTDSSLTQSLLLALSQKVPQDETVFVNYKKGDDNIEIFLETKWHLEEFWNRGDINFEYLDENNLCAKNDRLIFDRTSVRFVPKESFEINDFEKIATGSAKYTELNKQEVKKSFINGYRSEYWSRDYLFEWSLYKQKKNTCIKPSSDIKK